MTYRIIVPSDRYEDVTTDDLNQAWLICCDLSEEFGYAEVKRNLCGPEPILGSFTNGVSDT